jgi:predicted transcriptional regulator
MTAIKKWSPKHDAIIALHMSGKSNIEISALLGLTKVRVSQVISDPTGRRLIQEAQDQLRTKLKDNVSDRVLAMAEIGSKRLMETMEAEFTPGSEAKKHQDNKVVDILKGTGFLVNQVADDRKDMNAVSNEVAKKLTDAIEKAAKAERYKADIPTVDFELIESGPADA